MKTFKIADDKDGFLIFDLRDFLELLDDGARYSWVITGLEINVVDPNDSLVTMTRSDFEIFETIESSEKYILKWEELKRLSNLNIQILNGEVIARDGHNIIMLKVFDGSYWTVKTNVSDFIEKIEGRFTDFSVTVSP